MPFRVRTRTRRGTARPSAFKALVLATVTLTASAVYSAAPVYAATASVSNSSVTLTMPDGVGLSAILTQPSTPGPHPVLVLIASWGTPNFEYYVQAQQFASEGYIVLEYNPRGFYASGGAIDVASPQDVADVSTVITWLLAHTSANPQEIGVGGISYGAGLSLLAAAHDSRIKAVAAMSTWTDLDYSLYPNNTRHQESTDVLVALGAVTGKLSPDFQSVVSDFYADKDVSNILQWGAVRSPQTYVNQINANKTAVFISNGLQDSIFAPNQLTPFYDDLTTPKYLMLQPGDHATAEAGGLLGLPNPVWSNAHAWFAHYLTGADNGINAEPPVQIEPVGSSTYEQYASLGAVASTTKTYQLGGSNWLGTGSLAASTPSSWSTGIDVGTPTCASGGTLEASGILTQLLDLPPECWLPIIVRHDAAVWQSGTLSQAEHLRGEARLNLSFTPSAPSGTLYAYLYDVDWTDTAKLISYVPYSYSGLTPGEKTSISTQFLNAAYDIPAGHSLAVVVGTKDPLFLDADQAGSTVTFSNPSSVSLPLE